MNITGKYIRKFLSNDDFCGLTSIEEDSIWINNLIEQKLDINTCKDGLTALMCVSYYDYDLVEFAELIISLGADVNAKDPGGSTALHYAASNNNEGIIKLLLKSGANPDMSDKNNNTPFHVALDEHNTDIAKLLINIDVKNKYSDILLHNTYGMNLSMIRLLIEKGADINVKDAYGNTPIIIAASMGQLNVVKLYLKLDAKICSKSLHAAMANYHQSTSNLLLRLVAKDTIKYAITYYDRKIFVKVLSKYKIIDIRFVLMACRTRNCEMLKLLLNHESINYKQVYGIFVSDYSKKFTQRIILVLKQYVKKIHNQSSLATNSSNRSSNHSFSTSQE